jgi:hypothetical protein
MNQILRSTQYGLKQSWSYGSKPSSTTLRSPDWLKMKNRTCAAVKDCREFMTVGGGP